MESIKKEDLAALFESVAVSMADAEEELCDMDSKMGDGDLGLTMKKGFRVLADTISQTKEVELAKILMTAAMEMAGAVPSTMGTLMSSGVMSGGKKLKGETEITAKGYAAFLEGYAEGIAKRGKCKPGDRTVLDSILPAAEAAKDCAEKGGTLKETSEAAYKAAAEGTEKTKGMVPKFGKAAVHANVSQGVRDQGAVAGLYVIRGLYNYIK